ncbi:hypothetical protein GCM10009799_48710 [Nocardiopsis rhodophaea]|uniref:Uncharacterized protein n=1 Tax=Nocardiopsis rhodophaea TaxID=280238 RepID=A0ABN2TPN5_9ACTN
MSLLYNYSPVEPLSAWSRFRTELYACLTARADALFDLCDALTCAPGPVRHLAQLSSA